VADITVVVSTPGSFTGWGTSSWGSGSFSEAPGISTLLSSSFTAEGTIEQGWGGDTWGENLWGNLQPEVAIVSGISLTSSIGTLDYAASEEGWGSRTWGRGSWGIAGSVLANSFGLSTSIGTVAAEGVVNQGWGGDSWGENYWGELITNVVVISPTNLGMTTALGTLAYAQAADGWGRDTWGSSSWGIFGTVLLGQLPMTSSLGSVSITAEINAGWGANGWGNGSWGSEFSAFAQGQNLTASIGNETPRTDFTFVVPDNPLGSLQLSLNGAGVAIQIDGNIFVNATENAMVTATSGIDEINGDGFTGILTGVQGTLAVGQAVGGLKTPVDVTMVEMTLGFTPASLQQNTVESPTGVEATISIGNEGPIPTQIVGVSGIQATINVGSIPSITGDGKVTLTGIALTAATNTPNIFSWQEIDLGVNNTWTEVDLAA